MGPIHTCTVLEGRTMTDMSCETPEVSTSTIQYSLVKNLVHRNLSKLQEMFLGLAFKCRVCSLDCGLGYGISDAHYITSFAGWLM